LVVHISADPGLAEWVQASGLPVINTGETELFPQVRISAVEIAAKAIEHFRSCGLKNFAYVTSYPHAKAVLQTVFTARLEAQNTKVTCVHLSENPTYWDFETEERVAADPKLLKMLIAAPKPLAVLAHGDQQARAVCMAIQRLGLKIPGDVAVLGTNNTTAARTGDPPLSSIPAPGDKVGYRAMELLHELLEGRTVPPLTSVEPGNVIVRQSTSLAGNYEADVSHALNVIRQRACDGVTIKEILADLNISDSTLRRKFEAIVGHSPGDEMMRVRIDRAKELLATTTFTLTQIATATGYATLTSFTVSFKSQTSMTPRDYRKMHRK
jgi:LacI family transcriptional regulator